MICALICAGFWACTGGGGIRLGSVYVGKRQRKRHLPDNSGAQAVSPGSRDHVQSRALGITSSVEASGERRWTGPKTALCGRLHGWLAEGAGTQW